MNVNVQLPPYENDISLTWVSSFEITCKEDHGVIYDRKGIARYGKALKVMLERYFK